MVEATGITSVMGMRDCMGEMTGITEGCMAAISLAPSLWMPPGQRPATQPRNCVPNCHCPAKGLPINPEAGCSCSCSCGYLHVLDSVDHSNGLALWRRLSCLYTDQVCPPDANHHLCHHHRAPPHEAGRSRPKLLGPA